MRIGDLSLVNLLVGVLVPILAAAAAVSGTVWTVRRAEAQTRAAAAHEQRRLAIERLILATSAVLREQTTLLWFSPGWSNFGALSAGIQATLDLGPEAADVSTWLGRRQADLLATGQGYRLWLYSRRRKADLGRDVTRLLQPLVSWHHGVLTTQWFTNQLAAEKTK